MKALLFLISLCFGSILNNETLDKCNGIDRFIFGTSKEHFKNIRLELEQGNAQLYTMNASALKIPGVEISDLKISFIKNRLSAISIVTKNSSSVALLKYLKNTYGNPTKHRSQLEWSGKHVFITFELYGNSKEAALDFYSK